MVKLEMCRLCKEHEATIKGLCNKCYQRERTRKLRGEPQGIATIDKRSEQTKAIIGEYTTNKSIRQCDLAKKYGVTKQRIHNILKEAKLI